MSELTMKIEDTSVEVSESEDTDLIEQDDEATSPKQAVELVEYVLEELGDVLVNRLLGELAAINDPLEEERAAKAAEAQTLRASHAELQRRVEAQRRVFDVEIDRAIASGQDSDAEAKKEESAELVWNLRGILAQAEV